MTLVYSYKCLRCGGYWNSTHERHEIVCRRCWTALLQFDEEKVQQECQSLASAGQADVHSAERHVATTRMALQAAMERSQHLPHRLLSRFTGDRDLSQLRQAVERAEADVEESKERTAKALDLATRLRAPRARVAARQRSLVAMKQADQDRRSSGYRSVLSVLAVERARLVVRKADYKRGNRIDNHIRTRWIGRIAAAYNDSCFVCGSPNALTIDHMWMPKNDGGNFAVCVRDAGALVSNVLLLCRSCNAAKGERALHHFIPTERLDELLAIQRQLSHQMSADAELQRIASRWYSVTVRLPAP